MRFVVRARGEKQCVGRPRSPTIAERQTPQTVNLYGYAFCAVKRTAMLEFSFPVQLGGIERMDAPVAEIAD